MIDGFRLLPEYFSTPQQRTLLDEVLMRVEQAPLYHATMPRTGKPMSVKMTNLGPLGWVSDIGGYRYQPTHPFTGQPWPDIPPMLLDLWAEVADYDAPPEACLVNFYDANARLGLHVDADEDARDAPVVSVSLGDRAVFRLGGLSRTDATSSLRLASGDVVVLGGASRRAFHGVDRILLESSTLLPSSPLKSSGRINLTLRRVTRPVSKQAAQTQGQAKPA